MGEGDLSKEISVSVQGIPILSSMDTFVSLQRYIIPVSNTKNSPTFEHVIQHPFTTLLSSQSTDPPKTIDKPETDTDKGGFGETFDDLEFDDEEENFLDHMLMSMKQFKIINKKLNSIIQSQADMGGSKSVSSMEIDGMLKAIEARLITKCSGLTTDSES